MYLCPVDENGSYIIPEYGNSLISSTNPEHVIDYEIGFALPTIFTGKAGVGFGDQNRAIIIGIRPWPSTAFIQHLWNEKRLISIEIMIPHDNNFIGGTDMPIIINYGY